MRQPLSVAIIGNALPRKCGIATFTGDLDAALGALDPAPRTMVVAMTDPGHCYNYPGHVGLEIRQDIVSDYTDAADALNRSGAEVVSLQHEFGIFGGEAGSHILALLDRLDLPVVTTFHTVLEHPSRAHWDVTKGIVAASSTVVVMAAKGAEILGRVYGVPSEKILVIPHGIPDVPFAAPDDAKARLGYAGRTVILTFGLLSPNKGIEMMIAAMPQIVRDHPDAVYVVLGATHPQLVQSQGEVYRHRLIAMAVELGVAGHVVFLDQFVDQPTLLDHIAMCDVYVTPYLTEAQMTSGTLAYSFGLGKAVVSTPYWHARELLADGRGILVPFGDPSALGAEISALLSDPDRLGRMQRRAYADSRAFVWAQTAAQYLTTFKAALSDHRRDLSPPPLVLTVRRRPVQPPPVHTDYLQSLCDDVGILQHAIHSVPDRSHGYCVDDNARALLLACALNSDHEAPLPAPMVSRFASFVQHAWNPQAGRFRNFMAYDRTWLEDIGSEDSHGRTLWSLGVCALSDPLASRRGWAADLFREAAGATDAFTSPRAWAFTLLGLNAYLVVRPCDATARRQRELLAGRLLACFQASATSGWLWFEDGLTYDNARLSQALIEAGDAMDDDRLVATGLRSLTWLLELHHTPAGHFRPVGTAGFGSHRVGPEPFDQQPVEAAATVSACRAAWRVNHDRKWTEAAARALNWFLGENDLATPLADMTDGSCRDGLHPDRANENRGAESSLSFLLALAEFRQFARDRAILDPTSPVLAISA